MRGKNTVSQRLNISVACSLVFWSSVLLCLGLLCVPPTRLVPGTCPHGNWQECKRTSRNSVFLKIWAWKWYTATSVHIPWTKASYVAKFKIMCLCSFELVLWVPTDVFPEVGLLGQKADSFLIFLRCLHIAFHSGYISANSTKEVPFSTSLPALVVCQIINDSHSHRSEMICHCFNLHLSDVQ